MKYLLNNSLATFASAVLAVLVPAGCELTAPPAPPQAASAMAAPADPPKGGIAIPPAVRDNLGITFATVEQRAVAQTRRVPGQFELLPTARQEYRAPVGGRVELKVEQFQDVALGDVLFTIDSPEWRQIQHAAVEAEGEIRMAEAELDVARAHLQEAQRSLAKQDERLENLAGVKVRNAELEATATTLRSSLPRLEA